MSCQIYMDHAATTDMLPQVRKAMDPYLMDEYGNASTAYGMGQRAQKAMEDAREKIAYRLDAHPEEIFFTSGGSELPVRLSIMQYCAPVNIWRVWGMM